MNGIEKIIQGIEAETAAKKAALKASFDEEKKIADAECKSAVDRINALYKEKADDAVAAVRSRGETQKARRARDIKLAAKSELVRRAFSEAADKFGDSPEYPDTLSALLVKALEDAGRNINVKDRYTIRMRECDAGYLAGMTEYAKKAKGSIPEIVLGDSIDEAGFVLTDGEIEINCTAKSLIEEKRTALTPKTAAILFDEDN